MNNELATEALTSQKFAAAAAWFQLNLLLYKLLSALKRLALPDELHHALPKQLRFVLLNGIGMVVPTASLSARDQLGPPLQRIPRPFTSLTSPVHRP